MTKFKKRPVVIEAIRWDGTNGDEVAEFTEGRARIDPHAGEVRIYTLEGEMVGHVGDWIIKGVKGEFYPCKPDIFEITYEPDVWV